jgi:hypothetical protein
MITDNAPSPGEVRKLPLWRSLADTMLQSGLTFGSSYTTEFIEQGLSAKRDSPKFNFGIHNMRKKTFEHRGFSFKKIHKEERYVILQANMNESEMARFSRKASSALRRGVILGTNTPLNLLGAEERRRHESMLEKLATRHALIRHSEAVAAVVRKQQPKLLS